ncbi:MAG: alpha/beta fold hydrolase [Chloroflexi bacterium]|nr:alpha/beta fold hydrolase [Chloroflexota bacterium]
MNYTDPMRFADALAPFAHSVTISNGTHVTYADSAPASHMETVLLVHGLQDEADTWRSVFTPLARSHRVVAPDLPGFGRSNKPHRRYDIGFFADSLLALLDTLQIERAHLVGNSLGAMICEYLALTQPARAHSLTLVDGTLIISAPPPTTPGALLRSIFADWFDRRFFAQLRRSPDAAFATLHPYYAALDALPAAERAFLYQRVNERVWDEQQRLAALSTRNSLTTFVLRNTNRMRALATKSTVPTTVIWGASDRLLPRANGVARAALQPGARFFEITNAGHLPHQEQPEAFLQALQLS